jgi:hypothetical protein
LESQYYAAKTDQDDRNSEVELYIEAPENDDKCVLNLNEASDKKLPIDRDGGVRGIIGPTPDHQQVLYIGDADLSSGEDRSDLEADVERESHYEDDNFEAD